MKTKKLDVQEPRVTLRGNSEKEKQKQYEDFLRLG